MTTYALLASALLTVSAAPVPTGNVAPVADNATITVNGQRQEPAVLRGRSSHYLRKTLPVTVNGQHARWADAICPVAINVRGPTAALFEARIKSVARMVGLSVGKDGCRPNVAVVFAADASATLKEIASRQPFSLDSLTGPERRTLMSSQAPVRWWHQTDIAGADGRQMAGTSAALGAQGLGGFGGGLNVPILSSMRATRLDLSTSIQITGAVIVIDVPQATGQSLSTLADYVAMVSLSRVRIDVEDRPPESIMSLFDNAAAPDALGAFDTAFLKALYEAPANQGGLLQRSTMAGAMRDSLTAK